MSDYFTSYEVSILNHRGPSCIYVRNVEGDSPTPLRCHLYCVEPGDTEDGMEEMEALLGTLIVETVELHRRGAPYLLDAEEESLPVDLLLCNPNKCDPFLPEEEIKNSLVKLLNLVKFEEEEPTDDEDTTDESRDFCREFDYVIAAESGNEFKWLDPELPGSKKFEARATYVDSAGQIYSQLQNQRETVRVQKRLLKEKFRGLSMDCERNSFH